MRAITLFETERRYGNLIHETKLAAVGDLVDFECLKLENITWRFDMGTLPSRTYFYFKFESSSSFLAVLVESY